MQESIRKVLSEANNNLTYRDVANVLKKMGFVVREGEGSGKVYNNEEYHCKVTIHTHNEGARVPADFLREVRSCFEIIV